MTTRRKNWLSALLMLLTGVAAADVPPAGKLGETVAKIFSDPEEQLEEDLHNFKTYIESGRTRAAAM